MITLYYIHHDGFLLYTEGCYVLFDYYSDSISEYPDRPHFLNFIDREKPFYVVISHHHKDHFTRAVFEWGHILPNIHFVISEDVRQMAGYLFRKSTIYAGFRPSPEQYTVLRPGEKYTDSNLTIHAFGSTDIGNSYLVEVDGKRVFHAGDLNAWIWRDESPVEELERDMRRFLDELNKIALEFPEIDLAMFPVDGRLGSSMYEGPVLFTQEIRVRNFIPMHFCNAENQEEGQRFRMAAMDFAQYANTSSPCNYFFMSAPYSVFAMT